MAEITAALDQAGANRLLDSVIANHGTLTLPPGSGSLGPFTASYTVSGTLSNGTVDLIPPDIIRIEGLRLDWSALVSFTIDLAAFLPRMCLPRICIPIPCVGEICTPEICIPWPKISVTVPFADFVQTTVDTRLKITLNGGEWKVETQIVAIPSLSFGPATAALLTTVGLAITPLLLAIPFIGPFVAAAVNAIIAGIGFGGLTGLLGPMLTPFFSGLAFEIHKEPQAFEVLPADGPLNPKVLINIDALHAAVMHNSPEDELVLTAAISS